MSTLIERMVCVGVAVCCAGPLQVGCARAIDPLGQRRLLPAPAGPAQGGWSEPRFIEARARALDAMSARLVILDEGIARLRVDVAIRTVDGRLDVATGLVAATQRLEGQRLAAVHALQAARLAAVDQWGDVSVRLEGHLRTTQASYDATVAQLSR